MSTHISDRPEFAVVIRLCAVWLVSSRRLGKDSSLFWSQVIGCTQNRLRLIMDQCVSLSIPKAGGLVDDQLLKDIYSEVHALSPAQIKGIFDEVRK